MTLPSAQSLFGKPISPVGFGTGPIGKTRDRAEALRLLETAFDAGITYFDTARLYADGVAEGMIGEVFSSRRDKVTITTKAGILPPDISLSTRIRGKLATIARKAPPLRKVISKPVSEPVFGVFDLPRLRASVEKSLRALKTDHVDSLLLHECRPVDAFNPDVVGFVEGLKAEGKIRAWGVAPTSADMIGIAADGRPCGSIAQFANSAFDDSMDRVKAARGVLRITHSALARPFNELTKKLHMDAAAAARWRSAIDLDPQDVAGLAQMFLAYGLKRNPDGIVLFATTKPERVRENLRAVELAAKDGERIGRLPAAVAAAMV